MNNKIYFTALGTGGGNRELYAYDITAEATSQLTNLSSTYYDAEVSELTPDATNDTMYFVAFEVATGHELYKYSE